MRYRMKDGNPSKIKYQHSILEGVKKILEEIEHWKEIKSIITGPIRPKRFSSRTVLTIQNETLTGVRCLGRYGLAVQEVFIVTKDQESREAFKQRLQTFTQSRK